MTDRDLTDGPADRPPAVQTPGGLEPATSPPGTNRKGPTLTDLVPVTTGPPVGFALTPAEAAKWAGTVREMKRSVLKAGEDYAVIPGTGKKPTLLKPGAEILMLTAGLGFKIDQMEQTGDSFTYRCTVYRAGEIVAQCDGYCGRDEPGRRTNPRNTLLKMAQKRAYVGAVLNAVAASGLFAEDGDDQPEPTHQTKVRKQSGYPISEERRRDLEDRLARLRMADPAAAQVLSARWQAEGIPPLKERALFTDSHGLRVVAMIDEFPVAGGEPFDTWPEETRDPDREEGADTYRYDPGDGGAVLTGDQQDQVGW